MTGGATGIGAALKEQLRERDHTVIVVDIKDADVVADLSTEEGRSAAVSGITELAPDGLDGFIPCAGLGNHITPHSLIGAVNYFGVIATVEGLKDLVAKKGGTVLLVSSNSAPMMQPDNPYVEACLAGDEAAALALLEDGNTAYMGSKRALTQWMRRNVDAYAKAGVRMNAVAPGITRTPLSEGAAQDPALADAMRDFEAITPVGGSAAPEQIADAMRFLLSEDASFICGAMLFVDGGTDALLRPDAF